MTDANPPSERPSPGAPRWRDALGVYLSAGMGGMGLLGFVSGLPLAIKGQALQARMADSGMRPSEIGLFSLVGLPYVFKWLWAPLLDAVPPPGPLRHLGRRRGWLVPIQITLMILVAGLGLIDPRAAPWTLALMALAIAFASASQDIVIDALRIERFAAEAQAAALALYVAAYRVALLVAAAGTLALVAGLEAWGLGRTLAWSLAYGGLAALLGLGLIGTLAIGREAPVPARARPDFRQDVVRPVIAVVTARDAGLVLAFVLFFKLGDAMADTMTLPFALQIGFDKATYAWAASGIGLIATLSGGFLAGVVQRALGQWPTLWIGGIVQALANLALAWLALIGPEVWALAIANAINNAGHGFGAVVFVAYLSSLCTERGITATHYAILSALAVVGRTLMVGPSGFLAEGIGWPWFFVATVVACVPGLVLLAALGARARRAV